MLTKEKLNERSMMKVFNKRADQRERQYENCYQKRRSTEETVSRLLTIVQLKDVGSMETVTKRLEKLYGDC